MAKTENDNDVVEFQHEGDKHWAARGSKAYQNHQKRGKDVKPSSPVSTVAPKVETPKVDPKA